MIKGLLPVEEGKITKISHPQDPGIRGLTKTKAGPGKPLPPTHQVSKNQVITVRSTTNVEAITWSETLPEMQAHRKGLQA